MFGDQDFEPHGVGRLLYAGVAGGYVLEGYFERGQATGFARWIWADGVCYEGNLKNFKCHGEGKKNMGNAYKDMIQEGTWKNN